MEGFTMGDPQNLGLSELGQRVLAMSDPVTEPRLRPYQGAQQPIGAASNGSSNPNGPNSSSARPTPASRYTTRYTPSYGDTFSEVPAIPAATKPNSPLGTGSAEPIGSNGPAFAPSYRANPAPARVAAAQASLPAPQDPNAPKSGFQRAINAVRSTLPVVQRLLPLLDGNFATAIGALVAPHIGHHPTPPPPVQQVHVEVRTSHRELRGQVLEQGTTLKRVEDQLERVREATDRNTLEQQELIEDLRSTGSRISTFAIIGLTLLAISMALNIYFLVQLQHILR
jgi:hypothetical protein